MTLWRLPNGSIVDDQTGDVPYAGAYADDPWGGATQVGRYTNPYQYSSGDSGGAFQWSPEGPLAGVTFQLPQADIAYSTRLLDLATRAGQGTLTAGEQSEWAQMRDAAMSVPMRDPSHLEAGGYRFYDENVPQASRLDPSSPDLGAFLLTMRDKMARGTATPHEQALYTDTRQHLAWQIADASDPRRDGSAFGLGDNLFGALMMLGMGASGGAAAAALATGGLTLGAASGLAGVAGGLTSMFGEALDEDVLRKIGISLGAVGGATGLAALAQSGIHTVGDLLSAVQKGYGVGSKVYGLTQGAGSTPDAPRQVGSTSQALSAADQRTQGRSTTAGDTSMAEPNILDSLGPLLSAAVSAVGTGVSLKDTERYMDQLKTRYGQEEGVKQLIDEAYNLAKARYEIYYADTRQEQVQKQEQYQDAFQKYQTRYGQQQQVYEKQQAQAAKIEGQTDQDRQTQYDNYQKNRQKVDWAYEKQVSDAQQERDFQLSEHGADRAQVLQSYNRRVAEAQQDRQKEYSVFDAEWAQSRVSQARREAEVAQDRDKQYSTYDTQFALAQKNQALREAQAAENRQFERGAYEEERGLYREGYARQVAEAATERGLDLNAYQQSQAIGRNLSDPAAIKSGAEALYQPISALARDRINVQTEEEMARRGVAGGGQYSNLMAAKAFAPQERELWENAMRSYLTGQTGALTAYQQQNMSGSPEYRTQNAPTLSTAPGYDWRQLPEFARSPEYRRVEAPQFSDSPEYRQMSLPNLAGSPGYTPYDTPTFTRSSRENVPGAPRYDEMPSVPGTVKSDGAPAVPGSRAGDAYYPRPYSPYGAVDGGGAGGGGRGGALANAGPLAEQLGKLFGGNTGLVSQVIKLVGGLFGGDSSTDAWLKGGSWEDTSPLGDPSSLAARAAAGLLAPSSGWETPSWNPDYYSDYTPLDMNYDWGSDFSLAELG